MEAWQVNEIPQVKFSSLCLFLQDVQNQTLRRSTALIAAISFLIDDDAAVSWALCPLGERQPLPTSVRFKKAWQNGF